MAAGERLSIQMAGGGPWGFRLYGGDEDPLVVAKLRKRSKAHDAGLEEGDCLLGINSYSCQGISHGTAMSLVDGTNDVTLQILRGTSEQHAVDAAFQALGPQLRPVPASLLPPGAAPPRQPQGPSPVPRQQQSQGPSPRPFNPSPASFQPEPQKQVMNGFSPFNPEPKKFGSRQEQTFRDGDKTTRVTTETSEEKVGGTTVTKVKRETITQSYGAAAAPNTAPSPMFKVANVAAGGGSSGTWNPSGVSVQQNPDRSITMTIGLDAGDAAPQQPQQPLFKVSKFGNNNNNNSNSDSSWTQPAGPADIPLLPEEEAAFQAQLEAMKKPVPPPLQRVLIESGVGSDHESLDSPSYLSRRRMDSFDSDDDAQKRKIFADSAFYDDPEHRYPTIEEQVKMARKVAMSLLAPANKKARGHRMFIRRMVKSQKWTTDDDTQEKDFGEMAAGEGEGEEEEKYYNPNPWAADGATWSAPPKAPPAPFSLAEPPVAPPLPVNLFQLPKLTTGDKKESSALSANEIEQMRLFEKKTDHTNVSPQMCFDLASDLRNMKGKGGKLFAKRVARSEKWDTEEKSADEQNKGPNQDLISKIAMQAAAAGAGPQPMLGMMAAAGPPKKPKDQTDGMPTNRLKDMIDPPKPKMTPWDAAAQNDGNIEQAFDHLRGYTPYGRSHKGQIAENLDSAAKSQPTPAKPAPVAGLPTSGAPAKLPEFTRKIKPWGSSGGDNGASASGSSSSSFSAAAEPSHPPPGGFRPVGFKLPGAPSGGFQSSGGATSGAGLGGGATSGANPRPGFGGNTAFGGGQEMGYCDL